MTNAFTIVLIVAAGLTLLVFSGVINGPGEYTNPIEWAESFSSAGRVDSVELLDQAAELTIAYDGVVVDIGGSWTTMYNGAEVRAWYERGELIVEHKKGLLKDRYVVTKSGEWWNTLGSEIQLVSSISVPTASTCDIKYETVSATGHVQVYADAHIGLDNRDFGINDAGIDTISQSIWDYSDKSAELQFHIYDKASSPNVEKYWTKPVTIPGGSRLDDVTFTDYSFSFKYEVPDSNCDGNIDQHNLVLDVKLVVEGALADQWTDSIGVDAHGNII